MSLANRGFIGIKKEVTWKTRVTDPAANDVYLPFVSEGLTRDIEDVISAIQRGIIDEPKSYQGQKAFGGPLVVEVHPLSIGHILRSALGAPSDGGVASSTETEICDCETEWDSVDTTITSLSTDKKKGTYSAKIQVAKGHTTTNVIASAVIDERNLTAPNAVTHYKFWLKCDKVTADGNLKFRISEDELGGGMGTHDDKDILAMTVAGVWTEHTIGITDITGMDKAISIALIMEDEMDEFAVQIDDVRVVVKGDADKAYKHIFTPMQSLAEEFGGGAKDTPLWPYTLEVFRDEGQAYQFLGCVVNTLGLSFSTTDKILKANMGIIAGNAGYVDKTGNSLEATDPFVWSDAKIWLAEPTDTINPASATYRYNDLESFTLNWDNKCVAKYALNNSQIPRKIIRTGYREIPISFTVDFTTKTEYDKFLLGTERQMKILFTGAIITGDAESTKYSLQIDIPLLRYLAWPIAMGGPGRLSVAVTGKAKYDSTYALLVTTIDDEPHTEYAG